MGTSKEQTGLEPISPISSPATTKRAWEEDGEAENENDDPSSSSSSITYESLLSNTSSTTETTSTTPNVDRVGADHGGDILDGHIEVLQKTLEPGEIRRGVKRRVDNGSVGNGNLARQHFCKIRAGDDELTTLL